jgi:endonuclease/exonuclease/phosphatase (EEP) superfamily protein YafD
MKRVGSLIRWVLFTLNILVAIGFLISAYSPYISPVRHPLWACAGLFFPFLLLANFLCLLAWICIKWQYALFPLLVFIIGWDSVWTYCPLGTEKEPEGGEVIKLLTYNTRDIASGKDYDKEQGNPVLNYLKESDADIICLQEFASNWKVNQKEIDRALATYPYHRMVRVKGGSGLSCYSRYPILSAQCLDYSSKFNGSVLYRLKLGKDTLLLLNNHLESNKLDAHDKVVYNDILKSPREENVKNGGRYLLHKLAEAVSIRAPQADSVAHAIAGNRTRYMLVCGDFNDSPISYAHRVIGQGLNDVYAEAASGPGFTYNENHFYFRIDHIFASDGFRVLKCKVDRSIKASDHYPVWCLLEKKE